MTQPYPSDLKALTSLRFWAALWVAVYHFQTYFGLEQGAVPLFDKGYLAVDFFFVLSGFILAHVYRGAINEGTYRHSEFILKRLARVYPLHLAMLGVFVALAFAAGPGGEGAAQFDLRELSEQLLLVQAWTGSGEAFNAPAWTVSAAFFACLCFPLVMLLARGPWLMLAAGIAWTFEWHFEAAQVAGDVSTQLHGWRLMRIMPEFLLGAGLREALNRTSVPVLREAWATPVTGAGVLLMAAGNAPDWAMLISLIALVVAAAERGRMGMSGLLEHRTSVRLGEMSYALYMVHAAVGMAVFAIAGRVLESSEGVTPQNLALGMGAVVASIGVAALAQRFVETPGRWLVLRLAQRRTRAVRAAPQG